VAWGHHKVVIKGTVDGVEIFTQGGAKIARHRRVWEREQVTYEPLHYVPLLLDKPGALDHGAPFVHWELPECFLTLRRKLEAQQGSWGTKDYIAVLCLLSNYGVPKVAAAIERSVHLSYPRAELIEQLCLSPESLEMAVFCLEGRDHLKAVTVPLPDVTQYTVLLPRWMEAQS
jgi:hypothetical protein